MSRGRPFRFVTVLLGAWVTVRMAVLADGELAPAGPRSSPAARTVAMPPVPIRRVVRMAPAARADGPPMRVRPAVQWRVHPLRAGVARSVDARDATVALAAIARDGAEGPGGMSPSVGTPPAEPAIRGNPRRLRLDGWTIVRAGAAATSLTPQLGGSQAGFRLTYRLVGSHGPALFVRGATPLGSGAREAAAGMQWRLPGMPITVFVEGRAQEGRRVAPGVGVFGGVDHAVGRFRLSGYGQGGYAGGSAATAYADGQLRFERTVARIGRSRLAAGVGGWGAAQRGAKRLDAGPGLAVAVPIGERGGARIGFDWRLRLSGNARPGSGPALALGVGI